MRQKLLLIIVATIILMTGNCYAGQWLWHHNEEIKGQVVESDNLRPIEGALIVALWKLEDVVNEGPGGYGRVEVAESNKEGHFSISSWVSFKPWQLLYKINSSSPYIFIFKPGFKIANSNRPAREGFPNDTSISEEGKRVIAKRYGLEPAKLEKIKTDMERLESLDSLREANFPGKHFSRKQLKQIFKAFEEEISNLSDSTERKAQLIIKACELKQFYVGGSCDN